jgi:cobalamin biosynthesis Mg chelatase CobN
VTNVKKSSWERRREEKKKKTKNQKQKAKKTATEKLPWMQRRDDSSASSSETASTNTTASLEPRPRNSIAATASSRAPAYPSTSSQGPGVVPEPMNIEPSVPSPARSAAAAPSSRSRECMSEEAAGKLLVLGAALCCVGVLLILILVPLSFSYIEWDAMGFKRDKVKNIVYTDQVYGTGRLRAPKDFPVMF